MSVFISYAHDDRPHLEDFLRQLGALAAGDASFRPLSDHNIPAGSDWARWLADSIRDAEGAILLVSAAFLESKWCREEAGALYRRLEPRRILPVLLADCPWELVKWLSKYQFVNEGGPAVVEGVGTEERWAAIARKIWRAREAWPPLTLESPPWTDERGVGMNTLIKGLTTGGGAAFFLGPGIHEVKGETAAADHLRARFDLLAAQLQNEETLEYAESVVDEKLPGPLKRASAIPPPTEEWRGELVAFQVGLARLGSFASRLVAKTLYERHMPLTNLGSLVISLEQDKEESAEQIRERTELRNLFFDACEKVCVLSDVPSLSKISCDIGLGVQGILEQLMALTYVAFGRDLEGSTDVECQLWHDLFLARVFTEARQKIAQLRGGRGQRFLALAHLEWLGDLLWHTLRFDTPIYPSPGDLAFQLSVCASPFTPPRREKIGTIASLALPDLVDKVKTWLERCSTVNQHRVHDAVARALCDAWSRQGRSAFVRTPLAVTTNFDNELEQIFHNAHISHHILFPVNRLRRMTPDQLESLPPDEEQKWMLYTEAWYEDGESAPSWSILDRNDLETLELSGPLLVKLYGSPLTKIRDKLVWVEGQQNLSQRFEFSHRLIISDLDLLAVMVKDYWPVGLANLLFGEPNRLICFLGYSPADVDNRLRLYEHVRHYEASRTSSGNHASKTAKTRQGGPIVVMSPPEDTIYSKYLSQMQTQVLLEDLDKICMVVRKHCDCDTIEKARGLR